MNRGSWVLLALVVVVLGVGFFWFSRSAVPETPATANTAGIANPASVNCSQVGGSLEIVDDGAGAVGYCHLPDGRVCEEWSLYRGDCIAPQDSASSTVR